MGAHAVTAALEVVRFLLELVLLAALAVAGASVSPVLAVALPVAAAVVWGRWVAPKATRRLPDPRRLAVELVLFAVAGAALAAAGHPAPGAALFVASAAVAVGLRVTGSRA